MSAKWCYTGGMRSARDEVKPRGYTGRQTQVFPINLRLTEDQDAAIRARAERRGITASAACRELISLGQSWEDIERGGLYVTRRAYKFLGDGAAKITFVARLNDAQLDELADDGNTWDDDDRERLRTLAVLLLTTEEADQLGSLA